MLALFYWFFKLFLGLFWIVFEEILSRNKFLKKIRIYTSHNSPWCCAGDTGFLSAQFRESSIYLVSCSPTMFECNAMCANFHTRLHLELHRSDKIFNYDPRKRVSSEPLPGGLQTVSKAGNRCTFRNELYFSMTCIPSNPRVQWDQKQSKIWPTTLAVSV